MQTIKFDLLIKTNTNYSHHYIIILMLTTCNQFYPDSQPIQINTPKKNQNKFVQKFLQFKVNKSPRLNFHRSKDHHQDNQLMVLDKKTVRKYKRLKNYHRKRTKMNEHELLNDQLSKDQSQSIGQQYNEQQYALIKNLLYISEESIEETINQNSLSNHLNINKSANIQAPIDQIKQSKDIKHKRISTEHYQKYNQTNFLTSKITKKMNAKQKIKIEAQNSISQYKIRLMSYSSDELPLIKITSGLKTQTRKNQTQIKRDLPQKSIKQLSIYPFLQKSIFENVSRSPTIYQQIRAKQHKFQNTTFVKTKSQFIKRQNKKKSVFNFQYSNQHSQTRGRIINAEKSHENGKNLQFIEEIFLTPTHQRRCFSLERSKGNCLQSTKYRKILKKKQLA